jgi:hypothetical protein
MARLVEGRAATPKAERKEETLPSPTTEVVGEVPVEPEVSPKLKKVGWQVVAEVRSPGWLVSAEQVATTAPTEPRVARQGKPRVERSIRRAT